jgi:hypothetical protein
VRPLGGAVGHLAFGRVGEACCALGGKKVSDWIEHTRGRKVLTILAWCWLWISCSWAFQPRRMQSNSS